MKKMLHTVAILLVSAALMSPTIEARGRNNGNGGGSSQQSQQQQSRPGNSGRGRLQNTPQSAPHNTNNNGGSRSNNNGPRPGNNNNGSRPGNNNNGSRPNNNGTRPGNNNNGSRPNNNGTRPGNNGSRPGNNGGRPNNGSRPGYNDNHHTNHGPNHGHNHGYRPGPSHHPHNDYHHARPHGHPYCPYHRPTPPHHWHAPAGWRPFSTICGITIGSTLNISLNWLWNNGYTITTYGNDVIYLASVPMLGISWADATLYYSGGGLCGSSFINSTPYYDPCYYNQAYSRLVANYGQPYLVQNVQGGIEATWWGAGNQYIRLSIINAYANNGSLRYFTTLSFGI